MSEIVYIKCESLIFKEIKYKKIGQFTNTFISYENDSFKITVGNKKYIKNIEKAAKIIESAISKIKISKRLPEIQSHFYHQKYKNDARPICMVNIPRKRKINYRED